MAFWEYDFMHTHGLNTRFATPRTRTEHLNQRGLLYPPLWGQFSILPSEPWASAETLVFKD